MSSNGLGEELQAQVRRLDQVNSSHGIAGVEAQDIYIYICLHIFIYTHTFSYSYMERERERERAPPPPPPPPPPPTATRFKALRVGFKVSNLNAKPSVNPKP